MGAIKIANDQKRTAYFSKVKSFLFRNQERKKPILSEKVEKHLKLYSVRLKVLTRVKDIFSMFSYMVRLERVNP